MIRLVLSLAIAFGLASGQICNSANTFTWKTLSYCRRADWPDTLSDGSWEDPSKESSRCTPLGFNLTTLKQYNDPPVCVFIPGSQDHQVEILIQSVLPGQRICVTDAHSTGVNLQANGAVKACGNGKLGRCFTGPTSRNLTFYIYCDGDGCNEGDDVSLLYRIRINEVSWRDRGVTTGDADTAGSNPEMWCGMIAANESLTAYPADLLPDDPAYNPWRHDSASTSGATSVFAGAAAIVALMVGAALM